MARKTSEQTEAPIAERSLGGDLIQAFSHITLEEDAQLSELQPSINANDGNVPTEEEAVSGVENGSSHICVTSTNSDPVEASFTENSSKERTDAVTREIVQNPVIHSNLDTDIKSFLKRCFPPNQSPTEAKYNDGVLMDQDLTTNSKGQFRLHDEFLEEKQIGKGDNGTVMACRDWKTKKKIATKKIEKEDFRPSEVSLLAEVRFIPFIIHFLGATTEGSIFYLHMELFEGARHLEYFAQEGWQHVRSQLMIVQILRQLLSALDYLARKQIIHRDLTGRNILLKPVPMVKVIDFGLAVRAPYKQKTDDMPTGDPLYFAPEIFNGDKYLTTASDLWSAAINVIFLLRGSAECKACDPLQGKEWHPLMCSHITHCHPAMHQVLEQMLQSEWKERPAPFHLLKEEVFKLPSELLQKYVVRPAARNIGCRKPPGSDKSADGGISNLDRNNGDSGFNSSLQG